MILLLVTPRSDTPFPLIKPMQCGLCCWQMILSSFPFFFFFFQRCRFSLTPSLIFSWNVLSKKTRLSLKMFEELLFDVNCIQLVTWWFGLKKSCVSLLEHEVMKWFVTGCKVSLWNSLASVGTYSLQKISTCLNMFFIKVGELMAIKFIGMVITINSGNLTNFVDHWNLEE